MMSPDRRIGLQTEPGIFRRRRRDITVPPPQGLSGVEMMYWTRLDGIMDKVKELKTLANGALETEAVLLSRGLLESGDLRSLRNLGVQPTQEGVFSPLAIAVGVCMAEIRIVQRRGLRFDEKQSIVNVALQVSSVRASIESDRLANAD